ncbi:MAG: hypothetical protein U0Q16_37485 [Bryobacteraceae bacterium]
MIAKWSAASLAALLLLILVRATIPVPGQPEVALAALVAMAHVALWVMRKHDLQWTGLVWPLAAMPLFGVAQLLAGTSLSPSETSAETVTRCGLAVVFFLALQVRRIPVREIVAFGGVFAVASVAMHWIRNEVVPEFWLFPDHNHYAALMELLFPIAIYRALVSDGSRLRWESAAALAIFVSVLLCGSRVGAGMLVAEFVLVCFLAGKWNLRFALIGAAVVVVAVAWQAQRYREVLELKPLVERFEGTTTTLRMIEGRPLAGVGLGAWHAAFPRYTRMDPGFEVFHADDDWLEWAAEGGVLYPLVWLPLLWDAVTRMKSRPWSVGIVAACLHGIAEYPLHKLSVLYWLVALLGLTLRSAGERQSK